jgi:hypothetical protein
MAHLIDKQPAREGAAQGQGDRVADRRLQEAERSFAAKDKVAQRKAREAADAEQPDTSDPHTERQLDNGLKETFPASDPVSISPGAD